MASVLKRIEDLGDRFLSLYENMTEAEFKAMDATDRGILYKMLNDARYFTYKKPKPSEGSQPDPKDDRFDSTSLPFQAASKTA